MWYILAWMLVSKAIPTAFVFPFLRACCAVNSVNSAAHASAAELGLGLLSGSTGRLGVQASTAAATSAWGHRAPASVRTCVHKNKAPS